MGVVESKSGNDFAAKQFKQLDSQCCAGFLLNMNAEDLSHSERPGGLDYSIPLDQSKHKQRRESMSPLDLFIRDLDERKGKIPCYQEVTDIQTSVEKIVKALLLEVEKVHPFLKATLINSGSFYEGTKVGQPDEFDYFVQLDDFSEPADIKFDELPRSTVIVIPSESGFRKLPRELVSLRCGFDWKESVKTPFVKTFNIKAKGFEAYGMRVLAHDRKGTALQRHGPAYCLVLKWTGGERYRGLQVSVDLSLAVKINSRSSTMDVDLESPAGKVIKSSLDSLPYFFAVSAYNHYFGEPDVPSDLFNEFQASAVGGSVEEVSVLNVCLRCSQSCLEQALFRHFGSDGGPTVCLRVLKVLRDMLFEVKSYSVCSDVNNIVMDHWGFLAEFGEPSELIRKWINKVDREMDSSLLGAFSGNNFISSYKLKTLVLFEWEQNPVDDKWAGSNLTERFLNVLRNLRATYNDGKLFSFFYSDYKVSSQYGRGHMLKTAVHERITTLFSVLLATRDANHEYKFEGFLETILKDLKWTCHKMKLYNFLLVSLLDLFSHELDEVISRTSLTRQHFCSIYIQTLLDKIAKEVKLILPELATLPETVRAREAVKLFTEISSKRMESLENFPSFNFSLQAFEAHELAELLQFLCGIFKKDIEILVNELSE